jgi:hypothetical protein
MVTIVDYKERETSDGKKFYALIVQGGVETVLSEQSGRYYLTARQSSVTSTFNEQTCKELIGTKLPGKIFRIAAEPYDFTVPETGEILKLNYRWAYSPENAPVEEIVYEKEIASGAFKL